MKNKKQLSKVKVIKKDEGFLVEMKNFNGGFDKVKLFAKKDDAINFAELRFEDFFTRVFSIEEMCSVWENYSQKDLRDLYNEFGIS